MRVGFIRKTNAAESHRLSQELALWLVENGHEAVAIESEGACDGTALVSERDFASNIEIAVVLGGDGTMLRASVLVADQGVPIVGINLGRLGFLTPFDPDQAREALKRAIDGELKVAERMRFHVRYVPGDGTVVSRSALNDVVINQGAMARLIDLEAYLDDSLISDYRADGLIVATPTGSTAYNLAAGGPIVYPGHNGVVLTPICAHGLTHRPLVLPANQTLRIQHAAESAGVMLTIDGQWAHRFEPGDHVEVVQASQPLRVFASDSGYFDILREKLHWGARADAQPGPRLSVVPASADPASSRPRSSQKKRQP